MPAYQYKTEEAHQRHLAWRRKNYAEKRQHIRERDNATQRRRRQEDPERFREQQRRYKELHKNDPPVEYQKPLTLAFNADRDRILARIKQEQQKQGGANHA